MGMIKQISLDETNKMFINKKTAGKLRKLGMNADEATLISEAFLFLEVNYNLQHSVVPENDNTWTGTIYEGFRTNLQYEFDFESRIKAEKWCLKELIKYAKGI